MSEIKSYTIDKVGWHTKTPGNTEALEKTHLRFRVIIDFLQDNGLTTRTILPKGHLIVDETSIHTDDLTEDGLVIMKKCYQKWLQRVDRGLDPSNISTFKKTLRLMRFE